MLAPNVWKELFKMFELEQIMKQRESKHFTELLNRLREGNHSKDIQKLKQRVIIVSIPKMPSCVHSKCKSVDR